MARVYFQKLRTISHSNWFIFFFLLFVCWLTILRNQRGLLTVYTSKEHQITGVVKKIKIGKQYSVLEVKAKEKIQVFVSKPLSLNIGDKLLLEGKLTRPDQNRMNHLFNYRNYLKSQNIYWTMEVNKLQIIRHSNHWLDLVKNKFYQQLEERKEQAYYKAFMIGDQSGLTDSYKRRIRKLGISHLFALSGMHLSMISFLFIKILSFFKLSEKWKSFLLLTILTGYVLLTFQSPSILRAFFFLFLCIINRIYHLKYTSLQLFFYLCGSFLLVNPFIIYSTSFLYSFVVVFFLLYFKTFIQKKHTIFRLSFVATLASMPITLATSFEINVCSVFLNIIITPLLSMIIFPLCMLSFLLPMLEPMFSICLYGLEHLFISLETYFSWMITFKAIPMIGYVLYLLLLFLCLVSLQKKKKRYFYLWCSFLFLHFFFPYLDPRTKVVFLDVDQGDSTLISLANQRGNILIDTSGSFDHKRCYQELLPYLKSQGVSSLDALILTHGDYDHAGDAVCLVENFKIKKVIFNQGEDVDLEVELIHLLDKKHITYYHTLDKLSINEDDLYFLNTRVYNNENDNSNVIYFNYHNYKFLFMGDAGMAKEEDIIDKYNLSDIDILKVGHHGSNTSSSKKFIDSINPKYSVISVGKNNRYGHPNEAVLNTLKDSKIYRTDIDGSITFKIKNNKLKIETCRP